MYTPSPDSPSPNFSPLDQRSPYHQLSNPFEEGLKKLEQSEQAPPDDRSVIEALLGEGAAEDFTALLPHKEQEIPQKADLPGGDLVLTAEEAAQAKAREQETLEQRARAWFLGLGKDERWIKKHFTFKDGITCIAEKLDLSNCNITELPSFFKEIKGIKSLDLSENLLTTLHNIPKEIGRDLKLDKNPNLTSCAGLEGTTVERGLSLSYNPGLTSCAGLEKINVGLNLFLNNNPNLASLTGLEKITVGKDLYLSNNPSLTSLEGLPPVGNIEGELVFSKDQEHLIQEARKKGYNVLRIN